MVGRRCSQHGVGAQRLVFDQGHEIGPTQVFPGQPFEPPRPVDLAPVLVWVVVVVVVTVDARRSLCSLAPFRPASLTVRAPPPHQDSPLTATRRVRPCQEIHQVAQPTFSTPACDSRQLPGNHRGIDANTSFLTYGSPLGDAAMSRLQPAIALSCQWVIFTTVAFCKEVQADGKRTAGNRLPRC